MPYIFKTPKKSRPQGKKLPTFGTQGSKKVVFGVAVCDTWKGLGNSARSQRPRTHNLFELTVAGAVFFFLA